MARELGDGEVQIDIRTNEIVLQSGDRHCITGKEEIYVKLSNGEYKHAVEVFRFDGNSLVLYHIELGIARVEQVDETKILRSQGGIN